MTANQIAFFKAKNEAEHYKRSDAENQRHNFASEALNAQDLSIKDWANKENVRLGFANSAINQAHYERSDQNTKVSNQLKSDQIVLEAINTLGDPTNIDKIGFADYYTLDPDNLMDPNAYVMFEPHSKQYDYFTPQALGNYGKAASGLGSAGKNVADIITRVKP